MRKLYFLFLLPVFSSVHASDIGIPESKSSRLPIVNVMGRQMSLKEFVKLSPREYEILTGKKLKFKEKISLKIFQWKLKRKINSGATPEQLALGRKSRLFGILAYVFSFLGWLFPPLQ